MIDNQIILYKFIQINKNIDWVNISYQYKLSENFIQEFQDKLNWSSISYYQNLSENFIKKFKEEFKHKLND